MNGGESNPYIPPSLDREMNEMLAVEAERNVKVSQVKTFAELAGLLLEMGEIPGSKKIFSFEEQAEAIWGLVAKKPGVTLQHVTRTYGIRDKVAELLSNLETKKQGTS